jgi:predicted ATP-dependent Lon-type protease
LDVFGAVGFWDNIAFDEVGNMKIKDTDTIQIMKDYMANGRFSRGKEVIANASFSFVGVRVLMFLKIKYFDVVLTLDIISRDKS